MMMTLRFLAPVGGFYSAKLFLYKSTYMLKIVYFLKESLNLKKVDKFNLTDDEICLTVLVF